MPALLIGALVLGDTVAGALGFVWSVGRVVYVRGYIAEARKRTPGFLVTILASGILILGSLGAVVWGLVAG
jgi:glutathione S-transferase